MAVSCKFCAAQGLTQRSVARVSSNYGCSSSPKCTPLLACSPACARPRRPSLLRAAPAAVVHEHESQAERRTWDVSSNVISPLYRSTPWAAETDQQQEGLRKGRILFVGECNVCRSVLAEAVMRQLLQQHGLEDAVECEAKGTRNYNVGEQPEPSALTVAEERGLTVAADYTARTFNPEHDIVRFDMVIVMDKFTAADVLREVSSYDLINRSGNYSQKVRRLGDFHPVLGRSTVPDGQDIDDPLYGNLGGEDEETAVRRAMQLIDESCQGLVQFLVELNDSLGTQQAQDSSTSDGSNGSSGSNGGSSKSAPGNDVDSQEGNSGLVAALRGRVAAMEQIQWLVPPMLQGRVAKKASAAHVRR